MYHATLPGGRPSCLFVVKGDRKIRYLQYSAFGVLRLIRGSNFQVNGVNKRTCIVRIDIDIS
jgi:protein subunit release factor B